MLLAGEASGDAHGAGVAAALRARFPGARLSGTGGERMAAEGVELLASLEELAVMGFAEVVPRLAFFRRLGRDVARRLAAGDVDLLLPIDFGGFNTRAARAARNAGVPVLYYVPPKVWAWRPARARAIADVVDRLAVILPFEVDVWERVGGRVTFVGHPALDDAHGDDDASFHARWKLDAERPILALLPGSRRQEIVRHLAPFVEAARRVARDRPVQAVVARAPSLPAGLYRTEGLPVVDDARMLLRHARAALIKSGTATLEAAIEGTPMVVAYRTGAISWAVAQRVMRVPHVALPNLVAGERIVPELLQREVRGAELARRVAPLLDHTAERARQTASLARVTERLGTPGAADRVAELAGRIFAERR